MRRVLKALAKVAVEEAVKAGVVEASQLLVRAVAERLKAERLKAERLKVVK